MLVVLSIGVTVNIDGIRAKAEAAASKALGREVSIDGHLSFGLSFRPTLELEGLQIANPPAWDTEDFVEMKPIIYMAEGLALQGRYYEGAYGLARRALEKRRVRGEAERKENILRMVFGRL